MNPIERRVKLKKKRRNYDSLKNLFSSFAVTACAVVIAATMIPRSPKASFEGLTVFENQVVYQVDITDEDHALRLESLKIVLENQFESYEYPLQLGKNVGVFEDLNPATSYKITVLGSKGFGEEKLASKKLTTQAEPGGAIVSYEMIDRTEYDFTYQTRIIINGFGDVFQEVNLYVGYAFPDEPFDQYKVINIDSSDQLVILDQIPNYHTRVDLYLEAITNDLETIILDRLTFDTPFEISSSIYLESITKSSINYTFYPDSYLSDIKYTSAIYQDDRLIQSKEIKIDSNHMHYDGIEVSFSNLRMNTLYDVKITASYQNPQTLRNEKITFYEEAIRTLDNYTITYDIFETDDFYEITIDVYDPHHYFQIPYYTVYDVSTEFPMYIEGDELGFTPIDTHKYVTFTIYKPLIRPYSIEFGIKNQNEFTINHLIYKEIINS
ncbi:MAG: hypothetical protein EP317_03790 [Bacillota bacterium]|nr:MAG: hypothetical protein EP317_03790 [Bacillota bacterium]